MLRCKVYVISKILKNKMMKRNKTNYIFLILLMVVFACNEDDYLNRPPETSITEDSFWKTTTDLETYINKHYTSFPG